MSDMSDMSDINAHLRDTARAIVRDHVALQFRTEDAQALWIEGEQMIANPHYGARRTLYEGAVQKTLARLQRHATVTALVESYFLDELDDAFCDAVIHPGGPRGPILEWGRIEDAAYWRRYQELLRAHLEGAPS